jgi:hypothetical protein
MWRGPAERLSRTVLREGLDRHAIFQCSNGDPKPTLQSFGLSFTQTVERELMSDLAAKVRNSALKSRLDLLLPLRFNVDAMALNFPSKRCRHCDRRNATSATFHDARR